MNIHEGKGKEDETLIYMGYTNLPALAISIYHMTSHLGEI